MIGLRGIPATYGGVERAVEELAVRLVERGHEVTVYGRTGYSDPSAAAHRGVRLTHLPYVNTKHAEAVSHTLLAVAHALRSKDFDIVHLHATGPAMFSVLPKLAGVPCVVTVQGLDWQREKWGLVASQALRLAARVAATVPDETIVVSRALERELAQRYGTSPTYIPNGVTAEPCGSTAVQGLEPDRFLLFLGRLVPEKGVHTLVEAFRTMAGDHRLVIAGPPSHSRDYAEQLEALAAGDERIMFLGPIYGEEKAWLFHNAGLFVQPSSVEGLPIALLEAVAAGCYPVVSDIPQNEEVVAQNGRTFGSVFRCGDSADLAEKMREALDDPRRGEIADEARKEILRVYDWERIADDTEAIYARALSRSTRRPRTRAGGPT